jgi:hypothetical protein
MVSSIGGLLSATRQRLLSWIDMGENGERSGSGESYGGSDTPFHTRSDTTFGATFSDTTFGATFSDTPFHTRLASWPAARPLQRIPTDRWPKAVVNT